MFGDDPDPSVTSARFRFMEVSDKLQGGKCGLCRDVRWSCASAVSFGTVNENNGEKWRLLTNVCFEKNDDTECRCNANDAKMNATRKNKSQRETRNNWKSSGASVSGRHS